MHTYQIGLTHRQTTAYIPQLEDFDSMAPKPELKPLLEAELVPAAQPRLAEVGLL